MTPAGAGGLERTGAARPFSSRVFESMKIVPRRSKQGTMWIRSLVSGVTPAMPLGVQEAV